MKINKYITFVNCQNNTKTGMLGKDKTNQKSSQEAGNSGRSAEIHTSVDNYRRESLLKEGHKK